MFGRIFGNSDATIPAVTPVEAEQRLASGHGTVALVDVREPGEYARGHAKGARNVPLSQLDARVKDIPTDRDVLLICQSGHRSMQAVRLLQRHGYSRITNVSGGTSAWKLHNLPMA